MSCDHVRPELTGFHFGAIDPESRSAVEGHLVTCAECLREYLDLKRSIETAEAEPAPSEMSRARLRRAVAAELARPQGKVWSWWERPLAIGFAAASVLLALGAMHAVAQSPGAAPHAAGELGSAGP